MEVKEEEEIKKTIPTAKKLILETMEVDLEMKDSIFVIPLLIRATELVPDPLRWVWFKSYTNQSQSNKLCLNVKWTYKREQQDFQLCK